MRNKIINKRGQATVEGALVIMIVVLLLLAVVSVGLYIYDMSVYAFAANKAMDMGISKLSSNTYYDENGYIRTELFLKDKEEIQKAALDAMSLATGIKATEDDVIIEVYETDISTDLYILLTGSYNLGFSGLGIRFPDFHYDLTYSYYY